MAAGGCSKSLGNITQGGGVFAGPKVVTTIIDYKDRPP